MKRYRTPAEKWHSFRAPDEVVIDNGLDLPSACVREAAIGPIADLLAYPRRAPMHKGVVERFFNMHSARLQAPGLTE